MTRVAMLVVLLAACGGDKGLEGGVGPEGPAGPAGPSGPTGPMGPPGQVTVLDGGVLQGPKGDPGDPGPAGPSGPAGPMGAMGSTGPAGPMGAMGIMGVMGVPGTAGATGPAGSTGPAGPQGAQGVPGAQGPGGGASGEGAAVFSGFTTASTTGVIGGREKLHAMCAAQFAGAHLCHAAEYYLANSATPVPAAGAWIDPSGAIGDGDGNIGISNDIASSETSGRFTGFAFQQNCDNWTAATDGGNVTDGDTLVPSGVTIAQCTTSHVLACCATPYVEKFKGYTTATTTGVVAGRAAMHALCGAQFPGSHMCHAAEYHRATSTASPPAGGAWLDPSGYARTAGGANLDNSLAAHVMGRFTGFAFQQNCDNWTAATDGGNVTDGDTITTTGVTIAQCTTSHPVACCQ